MKGGPALAPVTNLNLRLLQTFMVVAETSSFREAGDRMHRSPSAISIQVKQLEAQLGLRLLYRTTRSVKLTAEGAELLAGTKRAMHEVDLGLRRIHESADIKRGNVSLACSHTVAATQLPRILAVFEKDYPAVRVQLRELHAGDLFNMVRQGEVDFGIGPKVAGVGADIQFEVVLDDPFMALMHRSLAPRGRDSITLKALASMPLLLQSSALLTRQLLDDAERKSGLKLTSKYECQQVQTLVAMAQAGLGAAIVPQIGRPRRPRAFDAGVAYRGPGDHAPDRHRDLTRAPFFSRRRAAGATRPRARRRLNGAGFVQEPHQSAQILNWTHQLRSPILHR